MRYHRIFCFWALTFCLTAPAFAHHIAVVTNRDNPVHNLTSAALVKVLKGETKKWSNGTDIVLVLHKSSPDEDTTLEHLCKMTEQELKAFLVAHKDSIRLVATDSDVIDTVAATPGAVGLVEEHSINDRITVVKVDGKLPLESGYLPH
jgi:ABC-type phosphate transport system substrate-binding protein